ncbi:MAG: PorT family protein [Deltaproteobacteria bacterium]|nr:PorT family protein [Deltaproteobacteria bacterium]
MERRHPRGGLIVAGLVVVALLSQASTARAEVRLGLGLGVNSSWYSVSPEPPSLDGKTGVIAGGFLEVGLSRMFAVQPGLRYTQKGFASAGYDQTEHYVEVPLLVKAQFRATAKVLPYVIAGPNLGYEAASYYSVLAAGVLFEKLDVALDLGAGVTFEVSPRLNVFLQSCVSLGLVNVVDTSEHPDTSASSRGIQVSGGVSIRL